MHLNFSFELFTHLLQTTECVNEIFHSIEIERMIYNVFVQLLSQVIVQSRLGIYSLKCFISLSHKSICGLIR